MTGSVEAFIDEFRDGGPPKRLIVINRTEVDPIQRLFEKAFGEQITVEEHSLPDAAEDVVVAVDGTEVIATSSLEAVMQSFLLINSDLFRTSARGIDENVLPDVLTHLDEAVLCLRGYPATNKERLLLIAISRYIERMAIRAGNGRLDAAFQRIARMDDEYGTRRVYERLVDAGVDVHVYGRSGGDQTWIKETDIVTHTGESEEYRRSWIVVYTPEDTDAAQPAALACWETGENVWKGTWSFAPEWVSRLQRHVRTHF